ncbi:hypothetical protein RhiirA1_418974 [Rhizophagus irregularis]|nr:hypothetical protein RhiirA1_418974 [Rhizophagus irregularis]
MKAGNNFTGSNSSIQDITFSSNEVCSSQPSSSYKPLTCSTQSIPYFNSVTPPHPPIFNANGTNTISTITPPHINSSEKSRGTTSTTPHSNSTIQPSNCSTPQVSSSSNIIRDSYNNPFFVPGISESSSENTPVAHYNNERLIRSGSSSKTISTNGGGAGYDSRSSSIANSIEQLQPYYNIPPIETVGSVTDIWNEWSEGINGNPSVISMMERYGVKWVVENEYHLKKRRIIVKEVQVRSEQIGIYEALTELERLRSGNSLLWLADRIRTREQEKVKI